VNRTPRLIAVMLALAGLVWGVFLLAVALSSAGANWGFFFAVFGPGYLVTIGYLLRAAGTPPLRVRQGIWVVSILVQGAWLVLDVAENLPRSRPWESESLLLPGWWLLAVVCSTVALRLEKEANTQMDGAQLTNAN